MHVRALREHDHCEYFNTSNCLSRKNVVKVCYAFDVKSHTMHYNRRTFYCIGAIGSFQHYALSSEPENEESETQRELWLRFRTTSQIASSSTLSEGEVMFLSKYASGYFIKFGQK